MLLGALALACLVGCNGQRGEAAPEEAQASVTLGPENVARVETRTLQSGPVVSGSLQARRAATLRAEVASPVLEMKAEQGQPVKRGALLARLDDVASQDQLLAARSAVRVAENALRVAEAEEERSGKLAKAGVITQRDFERAQLARHQVQAQLADAQSRLALAREQVGRTRVTAPFDGVVSERQANAGDVVQPGSPLLTVVDPRSLELDASVPAEYAGRISVGTPVDFRLPGGAEQTFSGKIERINPAVDPSTGQVRIYVTIPNVEQSLLVGLFAQGRVASEAREAAALPLKAVDLRTTPPSVLRVRDGKVERVSVTLGLRDEVAQQIEVRSGLQAGDVVVLGSAKELAEGTRVELTQAPPQQQGQGPVTPAPR
ncbi:efflux RND transporter periplasmic adaptor subunit [Hyalangium sp.]|uniref:efflux RND transporter periplasmic adaptor subunit n=1 Tax=Hyalangium sp. TaxID=2028555 RepID=UPI002D29FB59|nr:efflux RND transporter periplasmic adaptor subunit [Hyalangium sp.]HYH94646.1 efflux RND transporter periplasmic adaptor subunit [Hyalangium sp.]